MTPLKLALLLCSVLPAAEYEWRIPLNFPRPVVPAANPMSEAKVELGRYLFYDKRLSVNGKLSCGGCHRQDLAFTDGKARRRDNRRDSPARQYGSGEHSLCAEAYMGESHFRITGRAGARSDVR